MHSFIRTFPVFQQRQRRIPRLTQGGGTVRISSVRRDEFAILLKNPAAGKLKTAEAASVEQR
jgi:hypothetical protein